MHSFLSIDSVSQFNSTLSVSFRHSCRKASADYCKPKEEKVQPNPKIPNSITPSYVSPSSRRRTHHLFPLDRLVPNYQRAETREETGRDGDEEDDVEGFDVGVNDTSLLLERESRDESDVETDREGSVGRVEGEVLHELGTEDGRGDGDTDGSSHEF